MASTRQSVQMANRTPAPSVMDATGVFHVTGEFAVVAGMVINDIVEMAILPANAEVIEAILAAEDLDSNGAPTVTLDAGVMSGNPYDISAATGQARTIGNEFFAASTVGQAGGVVYGSKAAGVFLAPSFSDRSVGIKFAAAMATIAAGAKVRLTLLCRSQQPNAVTLT